MKPGKNGDWRGRLQPKRDMCPRCRKRGLGPLKHIVAVGIGQSCRYCLHITPYNTESK